MLGEPAQRLADRLGLSLAEVTSFGTVGQHQFDSNLQGCRSGPSTPRSRSLRRRRGRLSSIRVVPRHLLQEVHRRPLGPPQRAALPAQRQDSRRFRRQRGAAAQQGNRHRLATPARLRVASVAWGRRLSAPVAQVRVLGGPTMQGKLALTREELVSWSRRLSSFPNDDRESRARWLSASLSLEVRSRSSWTVPSHRIPGRAGNSEEFPSKIASMARCADVAICYPAEASRARARRWGLRLRS